MTKVVAEVSASRIIWNLKKRGLTTATPDKFSVPKAQAVRSQVLNLIDPTAHTETLQRESRAVEANVRLLVSRLQRGFSVFVDVPIALYATLRGT